MRTQLHHRLIRGGIVVVLLLAMALPLRAQMVTGSNMEDFGKTFGITAQGWSVQQTGCSLGANALWPREQAEFTFFVKPERAFHGSLKVDVVQYGTKGKPGDWWKPVVFKIADTSSTQLEVDFPEQGGFVKVTPQIGNTFGGYAIVLDPEFKRYLKRVLIEHGWPKGPINAVELWNEPWEGVSISGWGADIPRYRELYRVMAEAVLEARAEAGVEVLIGGACSTTNTRDKLFGDGKDTFLPWLDFVSIHYQPLGNDAPDWFWVTAVDGLCCTISTGTLFHRIRGESSFLSMHWDTSSGPTAARARSPSCLRRSRRQRSPEWIRLSWS